MTEPDAAFADARGLLFGVAYRMLGSVADAEDAVSEAWLRWQRVDRDEVEDPRAYLVTVVTRLCLDELRSARARRETYVGPWLPEPLVGPPQPHDVEHDVTVAESVSLALLVVLETLSPAERAVFVLREAFGFDYPAIAAVLDRSEAACRQLAHRARSHVEARQPRYRADPGDQRELADRFLAACREGDLEGLVALFTDDVVLYSDGGGVAQAALRPIVGADKVGRFLLGALRSTPADVTARRISVNGAPGLLAESAGHPLAVVDFDVADGTIATVRIVNNPAKLTGIAAQLRT